MVRLQIVTVPGAKSSLISSRLEELRSGLSGIGEKTVGSAEDILLFSEALFGRAPDDFLKRTSNSTLLEIATKASGVVAKFLAGKKEVSIEIFNGDNSSEQAGLSGIIVTSTDRPFIVDTLLELLRVRGLKHYVLLHPLVKTEGGTSLSLVYIEIDRIEAESERTALTEALEQAIRDVILITNDFDSLVSKARLVRDWIKLLPPDPLEEDFERAEIADFFQWLIEGGYVFLGYAEWVEKDGQLTRRDIELGLFQSKDTFLTEQLNEVVRDAEYLVKTKEHFLFSKLTTISSVHRKTKLDIVTVRTEMNNETIVVCFIGLLTSKALAQEASSIPLIKRKIESVLAKEGFLPNSHDYKELKSLIGTLPKGDLLQYSKDVIREDLQVMMGLQRRGETKVIIRDHSLKRFFSLSVFMPRDRFSSGALNRIQRYLKRTLAGYDANYSYHVASNEDLLVGLYFLISNPSGGPLPVPAEEFERTISELSLSWEEKLDLLLSREHGRERGLALSNLYNQVFPDSYKASISHKESLIDIKFLELLSEVNPLVLDLQATSKTENEFTLKLYKKGAHLTLSELLPFLENVGFNVFSETVTNLTSPHEQKESSLVGRDSAWGAIHSLTVQFRTASKLSDEVIQNVVLPGLGALILRSAESDSLNSLLLNPGLSIREIALIRTLTHYLWQLQEISSVGLVAQALANSPELSRMLVEAFRVKFDPTNSQSIPERLASVNEVKSRYFDGLRLVSVLAYDRALRALFQVVEASVRTNFFKGNTLKVSIKVECAAFPRMPEPRPLYEIFLCSPGFEGVHLRGGKVARGGIRWSERPDDFRTEIFGLLKTQMMKNSIIVPVGAKGGFIVKNIVRPTRDQIVGCYKDYIRGLLEITDNLVDGKILPPANLVRFDGDDPYFVVAADKGTAALSDVANAIAQDEFNFWLGDAFASGGSKGYSHKSFAITARGAWETTKRHFREAGIDINSQSFTVFGIGDMSGDVFGNGLLLSDNAKLVAAFDHRHIFLDPNPNPKTSFKERKRLFDLPQSSWMEYDRSVISPGGGVFDRTEKEILLTQEVKTALGTDLQSVSGIELIRLILKSPVDLFWNGGIGTYVKSEDEHNLSVGDRANDEVRINGCELRAKITAEGGNLGFTQRGRIEYASLGGRINTDAVDNSAGVNLSDLEVNIKILLKQSSSPISDSERSILLNDVAESVCDRVLERNSLQSLAISSGLLLSKQYLSYYRGIIGSFEKQKLIDREIESLPDDEVLLERAKRKHGLLRPELAILLACTKMVVSQAMVDSKLIGDPALERILMNYFPEKLQSNFEAEILRHPLRKEIIATQVANHLGESMGATFIYRVIEELGVPIETIVAAFLAAQEILEKDRFLKTLDSYDAAASATLHMAATMRFNTALDYTTRWILRRGVSSGMNGSKFGSISEIVTQFRSDYHSLRSSYKFLLFSEESARFKEVEERFSAAGFDKDLSEEIASLTYATAILDIIHLSQTFGVDKNSLSWLYGKVAADLKVTLLLELINQIEIAEHWDVTAQRTLASTVRTTLARLVDNIIRASDGTMEERYNYFFDLHKIGLNHYLQHLKDIDGRPLSVSALLVISNQLQGFWKE